MAVPEWVNRLRVAKYISPNGIESTLKIDVLSRIGGKKASMHEILNKNEAIPQDQGNKSKTYPIEAFFTGDDGDIEADTFYNSLHEQYSITNPGILKHPRWGDIAVMPFDVQQNENLVNDGSIFRVIVSFREIPDSIFPVIGQVDQFEISSEITEMESIIEEANSAINVDDLGNYAEFSAKIGEIVSIIDDALGDLASNIEGIEDQFRLIQADIDKALSLGASAVEIMSQVNILIRLPSQILSSTISRLESYGTMMTDIFSSFIGFFSPDAEIQNQLNQAIMFESLTYFTSAVIAEVGLFTDFETRDTASIALDLINNISESVENETTIIYQTLASDIENTFAPNHNTGSALSDIIANTNAILIERSFELKSKFTEILKTSSDPITLTWKYYKDMDMLDFFLETNNIVDEEFIEIGVGREIVSYA